MRLVPPLRQQRDRDAIRAALADGTIDALVSDHTPVGEDAKHLPFAEAEPGATGLELLLGLGAEVGRGEPACRWRRRSPRVTSRPARGARARSIGSAQAAAAGLREGARRRPLPVRRPTSRGRSTATTLAQPQPRTRRSPRHEMPGRVRCTLVAGRGRLRRGAS